MKAHRDLPPGSQAWADEVDRLEARVKDLETLVERLAGMLRVDPTRPDLGLNAQNDSPSIQSADKQKLSGLADVNTFNVSDGSVLQWSQSMQKWAASTSGDIHWKNPDENSTFGFNGVGWLSDPSRDWDGRTLHVQTFPRAPEDLGPTTYLESEGILGMGTNDAYMGVYSKYIDGAKAYSYHWADSFSCGIKFGTDSAPYGSSQAYFYQNGIILGAYSNSGTPRSGGFINCYADWMILPWANGPAYRPDPAPWTPSWDTSHSIGKGAIKYDISINKPIFFDGYIWRDAMGNAV